MRDIEKDKAMCAEATIGPWDFAVFEDGRHVIYDSTYFNRHIAQIVKDGVESVEREEANAAFIVEAREALPYWIGRYEAAAENYEQLKDRIRELESYNGRVEKIRGYGE